MNDLFYTKNICCPLCENSFKTTKIKSSKLRLVKRDTDFFRYFEGENPYFYEINVCPDCGFAFSDSFNQNLTNYQIDKVKKMITSNWEKKDYNSTRDIRQAIEAYKLALLSAQVIDLKASIVAGLLLRIAWLNRLTGNIQEEKRFMKGAIDFYEKAYQSEDLKSDRGTNPEVIVYLLGELNYRIGENSEAVKWFNLGISRYGHDPSAKRNVINMIRDRWMEIRQDMKRG